MTLPTLILVLSAIVTGDGARILAIYPTPSISHQVVFRPLTNELIKRGHQVVVITTDPAYPKGETPGNLIEINVHDISYNIWRQKFITTATGKRDDLFSQLRSAFDILTNISVNQILYEGSQKVIANKKFDLVLSEASVRPALVLSYLYKSPVIQISSFGGIPGNYWSMGASEHPFLCPTIWRQKLNNLSLWDKVKELYNYWILIGDYFEREKLENEILRRNFGDDVPTLSELKNNIDMLFLNLHPIWDSNRPVPPGVVYMGGMHQNPIKELPKDLKNYLDSSKNGVIYVSFGTNVNPSLLPQEKIQVMVKVFSKLPYDILWKWNSDELSGRTDNIKIGKWFPQSDLLRHPKVKLFITQAGLQSTDEAISAGVPLIGIPMLADQWYNAEKYVFHKIGSTLDMETLTENQLRDTITTIIEDDSYRKNTVRLGELMRDEPWSPLERAVWWVEHVLRNGGARHLRAPGANVSWTEYLELELVAVLFLCLLLLTALIVAAIYLLWRYISRYLLINSKVKNN